MQRTECLQSGDIFITVVAFKKTFCAHYSAAHMYSIAVDSAVNS